MEFSMDDLRELLGGGNTDCEKHPDRGVSVGSHYKIVVCQRGFVYAGEVVFRGAYVTIKDAVNLRVWGTTKGLGELALNGATDATKADACGTVRVHELAVVSMLDCTEVIRATL